jgi:hypothetical protein
MATSGAMTGPVFVREPGCAGWGAVYMIWLVDALDGPIYQLDARLRGSVRKPFRVAPERHGLQLL